MTKPSPIRVVIVDDSELFQEAVSAALQVDGDINVVAQSYDGRQALKAVDRHRPDLVVMDIQMPIMDGLEAIERIMAEHPTPILVMTADTRGRDGQLAFEAMRRGALDLVMKPGQPDSQEDAALRKRVRLLARIPVIRHVRASTTRPAAKRTRPDPAAIGVDIIAIVASTGGPGALETILKNLPPSFTTPIVIVQHITDGFTDSLASWLSQATGRTVRTGKPGETLSPSGVYLAPDGHHIRLTSRRRISVTSDPPVTGHRPSGDALLESVGTAYGQRAVGVVLTGMGDDGARGLLAMKKAGGSTIAQDEASSAVFGMPRAAKQIGAVHRVLALDEIAGHLVHIAGKSS